MRLVVCCFFILIIKESCGFNLNCTIESLDWPPFISGGKRCLVTSNLNILAPDEIVTSINDQLENSIALQNIKMFVIEDNVVHFIPEGIGKLLPKLEGIRIFNSSLKVIEKSNIEQFPNLKVLDLSSNDIEILYGNLFESNLNIRKIVFSKNKINSIEKPFHESDVAANILNPLNQLEICDFNKNLCIDKIAAGAEISELKLQMNTNCSIADAGSEIKSRASDKGSPEIRKPTLEHENLKLKVETLEKEKLELTSKLEMFEKQLRVCAENFAAAAKNLGICMKNLQNCENPKLMIRPERETIKLTCNQDEAGSCIAVDFRVTSSDTSISEVQDEKENPVECSEIQSLQIIDQGTLFLPTNLADRFPNLVQIFIKSSGLIQIDAASFGEMKNLIRLYITSNNFGVIPFNAFKILANLSDLHLSFNHIMTLEVGAFNGLENLTSLTLNDNELTTINFGTFSGLKNLKFLYLQNNKIRFISEIFSTSLAYLDLHNNECVDMSAMEASSMNVHVENIQREINRNCIAPVDLFCKLSEGEFQVGSNLTVEGFMCKVQPDFTIRSRGTNIATMNGRRSVDPPQTPIIIIIIIIIQSCKALPGNLGEIFPHLETLLVDRSELTVLGKGDFKDMKSLRQIIMRNNDLAFIECETFDDVPGIEYLDLSDNNIQELPPKIFQKLTKLTTLILSHNELVKLSADFVPRVALNSIVEFRADYNKIRHVEASALKALRKVTVIDLTGNVCITLDAKYEKQTMSKFAEFFFNVDQLCCYESCSRSVRNPKFWEQMQRS